MASLLSVLYCFWTSRRKPPALQVHINNESSTSDDYIPISIGTTGASSVTSCPSLQSGPHEEKNLARSFSSANLSALNQELLKLRSQRPKVKETGAVNLFPSCDEIPTLEQKSSSPSPLWQRASYQIWDTLIWTWSILYIYRSTSQPFNQSVSLPLVSLPVSRSVSLLVIQTAHQSQY